MNILKIWCWRFLFFTLFIFSAYSDNHPYSFLSDEQMEILKSSENLEASKNPMGMAVLYPHSDVSNQIIEDLESERHEVVTEILFLIDYPSVMENQNDYLYLINELLKVSEQKGIQYLSHRKQEMTTLIEDSYVQQSAGSRRKSEDPQFSELPDHYQFYGFQKDWVFGGNTYQYDLYCTDDHILLEMTNYKPLRVFGLIKAFDENELKIRFILSPEPEGIYAYAITYIKEIGPIVEQNVDINSAFRKRIKAILNWYINRL